MRVNGAKANELVVDFARSWSTIHRVSFHGTEVDRSEFTNMLGVVTASDLSWGKHVDANHSKASQRSYFLTLLKRAGMPVPSMRRICTAVYATLQLEHAHPVWHAGCTNELSEKLKSIQKWALNTIYPDLSSSAALAQSGLPGLDHRRQSLGRAFFRSICKVWASPAPPPSLNT